MASFPVDLPTKVRGESLLEACIKSAKELGLKATIKDDIFMKYSLGSDLEHKDYSEIQEYDQTNIELEIPVPPKKLWRLTLLPGYYAPFLVVRNIKKGKTQDRFFIWTEMYGHHTPEGKTRAYLSAVSRNLSLTETIPFQ